VVASLLLVYMVSMLAEQTECFVPFLTQSDFWKMQVTPRNVLLGLEPWINEEMCFFLPHPPNLCQFTLYHCHSHHLPSLFKQEVL